MKEIANNEIWEDEVKEESKVGVTKTEANANDETCCMESEEGRKSCLK